MLSGPDSKLFHLVNCSWSNPAFDVVMPLVTELGGGTALFLIAILMSVLRRGKDKRLLALTLFAGLAVTYYVVYFLKSLVARPRPFAVIPDAKAFIVERSLSFPSGHAAQAFTAATILSGFFKPWRTTLFIIASLICYSRVYIGAHFPSDVVAGSLIGILVGRSLLRLARSVEDDFAG